MRAASSGGSASGGRAVPAVAVAAGTCPPFQGSVVVRVEAEVGDAGSAGAADRVEPGGLELVGLGGIGSVPGAWPGRDDRDDLARAGDGGGILLAAARAAPAHQGFPRARRAWSSARPAADSYRHRPSPRAGEYAALVSGA